MARTHIAAPARAFTLIELLVSMTVLILLIAIIGQIFNAAAATTSAGNIHMNCDSQARAVLDRLAVDLGQMVIRRDVDYYLKSTADPQPGNDHLAFYSQVPGYYPAAKDRSPYSLVAYRVSDLPAENNPNLHRMQRMGKGLLWNGASTSAAPLTFLPVTIVSAWPTATNMDADADYETVGPQVFRLEYNYLLRGQTAPDGTQYPPSASDTPWDTRITGHTSVNGFDDVAALAVNIAVIDSRDRLLVPDTVLGQLTAAMNDFDASKPDGALKTQWAAAVENPANSIPRSVADRIRIYTRTYALKERPTNSL